MNNSKFIQFITVIVFLCLFLFGMYIYFFVFNSNIDTFSDGFFPKIMKTFKVNDEKINVLVMGIDNTSKSTDTIMVVNFSSNGKAINALMIPRDTKVKINGASVKINSAYAKGDTKLAMEIASKLLRVPINSYIIFDTTAFRKTIDILGGVKINVPIDMDYEDPIQNLNIHLKKGTQVLDGEKSEQYIRYRSGYVTGDLERVDTQKDFIKELLNQKLNAHYISKLDDIIGIAYKHVKTNISTSDTLKYARSLSKINIQDIHFFTLPGTPVEEDLWYYIPDLKQTDEIISKNFAGIIYDTPRTRIVELDDAGKTLVIEPHSNDQSGSKHQLIVNGTLAEDNLSPMP